MKATEQYFSVELFHNYNAAHKSVDEIIFILFSDPIYFLLKISNDFFKNNILVLSLGAVRDEKVKRHHHRRHQIIDLL